MFKLQFKENPNRSFWLVGEKISIGSAASNTVVLDGLGIEEHHAELLIQPDQLILKSKPGSCIVNDLPVDGEHILKANDELRIGRERMLIFDPKNPPKAAPKRREPAVAGQALWRLLPDHPKLREKDFTVVDRAVIGRSPNCQFSVPYKLLSREHGELRVENGELHLRDMGSANGCFVNGARVDAARLSHGDKVSFAKLGFTVEALGAAPKPAAVAVAEEELNRTMIRPAINLDAVVTRTADEATAVGDLQLELEPMEEVVEAENANTASGGGTVKWLAALVVLAGVGAGAWLLMR